MNVRYLILSALLLLLTVPERSLCDDLPASVQIDKLPEPSKRFALIIGVESYKDPQINSLKGPNLDAKSLSNVLVRWAGFPQENVFLLASDQPEQYKPSRDLILRKLTDLKKLVTKDSLLVFAFSGHGIVRKEKGYLLPESTQISNDLELLEDTSLSLERLLERIRATSVRQVIMLLDACRDDPEKAKGSVDNTMTHEFTQAFDFVKMNKDIDAFAVLYAAKEGYRAFTNPKRNDMGFFTAAVVEGLEGQAANMHSVVTLGRLIAYLDKRVPVWVKKEIGKDQYPRASVDGFQANDLVIAGKKTEPPPHLKNVLAYVQLLNTQPQVQADIKAAEEAIRSQPRIDKQFAFHELFISETGQDWITQDGYDLDLALLKTGPLLFDRNDGSTLNALPWKASKPIGAGLTPQRNALFLEFLLQAELHDAVLRFFRETLQAGRYDLAWLDIPSIRKAYPSYGKRPPAEFIKSLVGLIEEYNVFKADYFFQKDKPVDALASINSLMRDTSLTFLPATTKELEKAYLRQQSSLSTPTRSAIKTLLDFTLNPFREMANALHRNDPTHFMLDLLDVSKSDVLDQLTAAPSVEVPIFGLLFADKFRININELAQTIVKSKDDKKLKALKEYLLNITDRKKIAEADDSVAFPSDALIEAFQVLVGLYREREAQDRLLGLSDVRDKKASKWACETLAKVIRVPIETLVKDEGVFATFDNGKCPKVGDAYRSKASMQVMEFDASIGWFRVPPY